MEREIRLRGHLIDEGLLSAAIDLIAGLGGQHSIVDLRLGADGEHHSEALLRVEAQDDEALRMILRKLAPLGAEAIPPEGVRLAPAPALGVLPEGFYATSNLPTEIYFRGAWLPVGGEEMDLVIVVDAGGERVESVPMNEVPAGALVVVGEAGIRVARMQGGAGRGGFHFMASEVSSEKPKGPQMARVVEWMRMTRRRGEKVLLVAGPAVIHTGAGPVLERLIEAGWVDVLFAGNALAAHDIEQALYGTSLGVPLEGGASGASGHAHHLWAINAVRTAGSLHNAVSSGLLRKGVMHACVRRGLPIVLAGSIRDDGPLPDVITDSVQAQKAMRSQLPGVGMALMIGSTLHSVATGNLLPARVFTVCVDINPGAVTKLRDRGSRQSLGIVMDAGSFLEQLEKRLED